MSSAAARAEARRKAILSRGADRLSKLTTSARGEDAPAYMHDDPPLAPLPNKTDLKAFVGEESQLPTPPAASRNVSGTSPPSSFQTAGLGGTGPDPSVWTEEQQQQLLSALMGGTQGPAPLPGQSRPPPSTESAPPPDDPLAALMAMLPPQGQNGSGFAGMKPPGFEQPPAAPRPKSRLQKIMPLIHLLAAWMLLLYFVLWKEPEVYAARMPAAGSESLWRRWAELSWRAPEEGWGVQPVPLFWAFTTLTLVLHSWRILSGFDTTAPPTLIALALPFLPAPIPSLILNGLKYLQIGGVFLDDVAALLVGIGLLIWLATWLSD